MNARIKKWLPPPDFPGDEDKTAQAQILNTAGQYFVIALIVGSVILVPFFVRYKIVAWAIILTFAFTFYISRRLLFRGKLGFSATLMIISVWIVGISVSIFGGGISSPMLYVVLADTIIVGYLLERRTGNSLVLASIVIVLGMAIVEQNGISIPQILNFSPISTWFMFALSLWFVHAVMTILKSAQYEVEGKLKYLARTDSLTDLHNRHYFLELAEKEVERAIRYNHTLSCIIFDIDNFKEINDGYGHFFGDKVLQKVARCCEKDTRQVDILARLGGDEFVILLPETQNNDALIAMERIRNCLKTSGVDIDGKNITVALSAGIADLKTANKLTLDELLSSADQALYQSKESGRDRVTVWNENDGNNKAPS